MQAIGIISWKIAPQICSLYLVLLHTVVNFGISLMEYSIESLVQFSFYFHSYEDSQMQTGLRVRHQPPDRYALRYMPSVAAYNEIPSIALLNILYIKACSMHLYADVN